MNIDLMKTLPSGENKNSNEFLNKKENKDLKFNDYLNKNLNNTDRGKNNNDNLNSNSNILSRNKANTNLEKNNLLDAEENYTGVIRTNLSGIEDNILIDLDVDLSTFFDKEDLNYYGKLDDLKQIDEKLLSLNEEILVLLSQFLDLPLDDLKLKIDTAELNTIEDLNNLILNELNLENEFQLLTIDNYIEFKETFFDYKSQIENLLKEKENSLKNFILKSNLYENRMFSNNKLGDENSNLTDQYKDEFQENEFVNENITDTEENSEISQNTDSDAKNITKINTFNTFNIEEEIEYFDKNILFNQEIEEIEIKNFDTKVNNFYNSQLINNKEIIDQIINKVEIDFNLQYSEIKMSLKPEHLGDLHLKIITENGLVTAQFVAESKKVKEIIESSLLDLSDALKNKDIAVNSIEVTVNSESNNNDNYNQFLHEQSKNSKRIKNILSSIENEESNEFYDDDEYIDGKDIVKSKISYKI